MAMQAFCERRPPVDTLYCPYCMSPAAEGSPCPGCGLTAGSYRPKPHHLPPGTVLMGRYLVGRALGEGGFGITYLGRDLRLELRVAIKEYFPTAWVCRRPDTSPGVSVYTGAGPDYEKGRSRFLFEARTMARMEKQPEIVGVRDFFEANGTAYIVMEYLDGTTFKELVRRRGRIPARELLDMIEPVFSALSAMHAAGLIHRDISPDNLMLERDSVRLLDFGCARESALGEETVTITLKHGYAPIEQYQHKGQGPWTDVYALTATIYYCLTGRTPPQALDRLMDDELIPPRRLGAELTEAQERALLRGMGIRQHRRWRSMEEFRSALYGGAAPEPAQIEAPAGQESLAEAADAPDSAEPHPGRRKRRRIAAAAAAALLALAMLAAAFLPRGSEASRAPAAEAAEYGGARSWDGPGYDELFADAACADSVTDFAALMSAGYVKAIVVDGSLSLESISVSVTKPVCVPAGSSLENRGGIYIAEGGVLWLEGGLSGGGSVIADGGAYVAGPESHTDCFLVSAGEGVFTLPGGGEPEAEYFPGDGAFASAVTVRSYAALRSAAARGESVRVAGNITLEGDVSLRAPLLIEEGAGISGGYTLVSEGAAVVNNGALGCGLSFEGGSASLMNRGSLTGGVSFAGDGGLLCNLGGIELEGESSLSCAAVNAGTVTLASGDAFLSHEGGDFFNSGGVFVDAGAYHESGRLRSAGSVRIAGEFVNQGCAILVGGSLTLTATAKAENRGVLDLYDGGAVLEADALAYFDGGDGVILGRYLAGRVNTDVFGKVWDADFTPIDGDVKRTEVTSAGEFLAALADPDSGTIVVTGAVNLAESLTLTKHVFVESGCLLVRAGNSLTVDGAIFCVNGMLCCDDLRVTGGGMAEIIGEWRGLTDKSRISVSDGSWVYTRESILPLDEINVDATSMMLYSPAGGPSVSAHNARLRVGQ